MSHNFKRTNLSHLLFLLITILPILSGCGSTGGDEPDMPSSEYLNVTNQVSISGNGNLTAVLEIKADCSWTITGNPSWMTLSANSGNGNASINITCTPNPSSADERSAVLTVTSASGKIKRQVAVIQPASTEAISVSVNELKFEAKSESKILSITSNTSWSIRGTEDWITLSRESGEGSTDITITVAQNQSENSRQATLTIHGSNVSSRVTVTQEGKSTILSISPTSINTTAIGNTYEITIEGDAQWTASSNQSWAVLSNTTGNGNAKVTVTVKDNTTTQARQAELTFSTSKNTYTCTVKQQAATLPEVGETTITDIEKYSVKAYSSHQSEFIVLDCGFCYSQTNSEPTIKDEVVMCDEKDTTTYATTISGLQSGRTYYIRAYAKSEVGISYGPVKQFTTKGDKPGSGDNPTPEV